MSRSVSDEIRYRLLRYLEEHPDASQRELAKHLGASLGKINYCLQALIAKGLLKMRNFRGSKKKLAYAYVLTPKGIEERINVTSRFLKRKLAEYDSISAEIERLTKELADNDATNSENATIP
ncbi:MAG TPA: MarR family EPS-associated transcriptional regulator [Thermoanaerobaculia bacterium]|nr:MarR family EPS-associated transcriptional regulator [Thermoanaerobaculia bacterium]